MKIKGGKTLRGYTRYQFTDITDQPCELTEGAPDGPQPAIWFGLRAIGKRMCLTQDQVAALMPYLVYFVENGDLPQVLSTGGDDA